MLEPFKYIPEMENSEELPVIEHGERRSGLDRRQFAFGCQGPDRRSGIDRRGRCEAAD